MRVTPVPVARALALAGGTLAWATMGARRRTLHRNMAFLAPARTPAQRARLVRRTFRNMALAAVDLFRLPSMSREDLRSLFEVRGLEHVESAMALGKGAVLATAHLGPYELASAWVAASGIPVSGMVENLEPDVLDALEAYRSATGMQLVNMKDGLRGAYRALNEGRLLALVSDRAIGDARSAVEVPFAAGRRRFPVGPAVFAQATGAPLLTGFTYRNPAGRPRYVMEIEAPVFAQGRDPADRDRLVRHVVSRMERAITAHPDEWFVFQPEWEPDGRA